MKRRGPSAGFGMVHARVDVRSSRQSSVADRAPASEWFMRALTSYRVANRASRTERRWAYPFEDHCDRPKQASPRVLGRNAQWTYFVGSFLNVSAQLGQQK
jgi:hypothetical protein